MDNEKKKRERGEGGLFTIKGSANWYIKVDGKRIATGTPIKAVAIKKLQERMGRVSLGIQSPEELRKLRYEQVRDSLLAEYRNGKQRGHSLVTKADGTETIWGLNHLDKFFAGRSVVQITTDLLREFVALRKKQGASHGTVNRNMGLLRRMLHLARKEDKLQRIPHFPMLEESAPRNGFVNDNQFKKLLVALPVRLRPFVLFLYTTGCRTGEAKQITWEQVHLDERVIRLAGTQTKNATPRTLPLVDMLVTMLRKQKKKKGLLFPVGNFRKAWTSACIKAGLGTRVKGKENGNYGTYDGLIPHDLRRSAVRNMIRVGVSQTVAMSISGHKTIAVFQRYDITDERDRQAAMTRVGSSLGQVLPAHLLKAAKSA